jgi:acyl-CoA thioesterase-1
MRGTHFVAFLLSVVALGAANAAPAATRILFLGDSLTEGYGLSKEEAFPALVEKTLREAGYAVEAINAGINGSTTASAVSRLRWHLRAKPRVLVLALGANDGLRGLPVAQIRANLARALELASEKKLQVLLVGMKMPPNYGPDYARAFERIFPELARRYRVRLVPFLLERVAGEGALNLADGIHPNAEGHRLMAEAIAQALRPLLPLTHST